MKKLILLLSACLLVSLMGYTQKITPDKVPAPVKQAFKHVPDALRLCSEGLRDSDLAYGCQRVAEEVDEGRVLYESMAGRPQFPPSLIPLVEWGQRAPALADAFRAAAEMFEGRVRSQTTFLEAVLLPVMLLLVVSFIGAFVVAMMLPMISLIRALSTGFL